jgi:two-component system response regulator AtoC
MRATKTREATQLSLARDAPIERAMVIVGTSPPRTLELSAGSEIVFGRAEDCAVRLDDETLSRRHASLALVDGRLLLRDLGSRNGVKVEGVALRDGSRQLGMGASFRLGKTDVFVTVPRVSESGAAEASALIAADDGMRKVVTAIEKFAPTDLSVLVLGETGVGKEVVANAIHARSRRARGAFVALHCAALPQTVLESELFGHERGAFTGADKRRIGWLESAAGGTLFLDELGELPASTQVKLLRFLETKRLARVGSNDEIEVDVRLVAATNEDLDDAVARGGFREDLYYRVAACVVRVPPLRERRAEIPLLAAMFAERAAAASNRPVPAIEPSALDALARHAWPGNVRELRNAIEHAVALSTGALTAAMLPESVTGSPMRAARTGLPSDVASLERASIEEALELERGNRTHAAKRLGVSRRALLYKMKKYGLS